MWFVIALIILFILFIILLWTKLTIVFDYYHGNDNDYLKLEFSIWFGLIKYKKEVPMIKIDENSPKIVFKEQTTGQGKQPSKEDVKQISKNDVMRSFRNAKKLLLHVIELHKIVRIFLRKVNVKQVEWHTVLGVGDAAYTGMIVGAIWAAKGSIVGIISHYMKLKEMPRMTVTPSFQHAFSQISFRCMFQFRIGQAMLAGIKLIKFWKGGLPHFEKKPKPVLSRTNGQ